MDRKKKAEHTRNRERPCLGIATPRRATAKANGIAPWPPRHAQSAMMSHIYALTCVNVLDRIADSRPLLRLEAQSRRESLRTNENGCPWGTDGFLLRFPVFGGIGLPGKGSVRKYDAHQGVPAEMSYFLCRLLRRTRPREAAPYQL